VSTSRAAVQTVASEGRTFAVVVRGGEEPAATEFVTPDAASLQVGFVVYSRGGSIAPHSHRPLERKIVGTGEVLVVRKGRCEVDVFDDDRRLIATEELRVGDIVVFFGGGHGFRMVEDTVLLEVKQGPYTGLAEKERF
jgi:quercetin dioxygenase-like cupin family protein